MDTTRRNFLGLACAVALVLQVPLAGAARAEDKTPIFMDWRGRAIRGYDPVAYFTEGQPKEGSSDFTYQWNGATWYFSSAANRDLFAASPEKYAPQYGGYCAFSIANGAVASVDPEAWKIVEGKLYLNYSRTVFQKWLKDVPGYISKANTNWPSLKP